MSKNFLIKCFKSWFELKIPFASTNTKLKEEFIKYNIRVGANGEIILPPVRYKVIQGTLVNFYNDHTDESIAIIDISVRLSRNSAIYQKLIANGIQIKNDGMVTLPPTITYKEVSSLIIFFQDRKSFLSVNINEQTFLVTSGRTN